MNGIRRTMLFGVAAGLCVLAACSGSGTGGEVKVVGESPAATAPAEAEATPGAGGTPGTAGATGSAQSPPAAHAPAADPRLAAAVGVAQQWIAFVDQGQYAESWSAAGRLFQSNMQQQQWAQTLTGARTPLGTVVSREVAGSEIRESLPGAPAGQYALVSFATNFQNKPDIIETVTMMDEGGQWKVVGYSANPRAALEQQQQQQQGQPGQGQMQPQTQPQTQPTPTPTPPQL